METNPGEIQTSLEFWNGGINSALYPTNTAKSQYIHGENIMIRGGVPQARLGKDLLFGIPGERLQGFRAFQPTNALPVLVVAVDGKIYISRAPFAKYTQLPGIQFSPNADRVVFQPAIKGVQRQPDESLKVIKPLRVLMMQDGVSRAAYWDGSNARHLNPDIPFRETPTGLWMAWSGGRLWIASGNHILASDLEDPFSHTEATYTAERDRFTLPGDCTGLIEAPDKKSLLAFDEDNTTSFQSSIRDRKQWQLTPDFQYILTPGIGNLSGRAPVNHHGKTYWFSKNGLIDLDTAVFTQRSSQLSVRDSEMMRSKRNISHTTDRICAIGFENLLLFSVPSGDIYNAQTWVMDHSVVNGLNENSPAAWASVWTGTRPVEWSKISVFGQDRCFCACYDATPFDQTRIHVWEEFLPSRKDRGNRIACQFQTPLIPIDGNLNRFKYAKLDLVEVLGDVTVRVYLYGTKGGFTLIYDGRIRAEEGCIGSRSQEEYTTDTIFENYVPQTRIIHTNEPSVQTTGEGESPEHESACNIDTAFGLLVEWRGRMGIKSITLTTAPIARHDGGTGERDESRTLNIVTEAGVGSVAAL